MIRVALDHGKPVRIGVNWGSLDQALLTRLMDENARQARPRGAEEVTEEAMVESALRSARRAEEYGLPNSDIILSAKVSSAQSLIDTYRTLAARCEYPLHLGLTEAGLGVKGIVASTAALAILLQEGIGDTIPSLANSGARRRPYRGGASGPANPAVARASQLHSAGQRLPRLRPHHQYLFPGDGRPDSDLPARPDAGVARSGTPAWKSCAWR